MNGNRWMEKWKQTLEEIVQHKEKMILLVLAGMLLLVICLPTKKNEVSGKGTNGQNNWLSGNNQDQQSNQINMTEESEQNLEQYTAYLERRLKEQLMSMDGVGEVSVMITLSKSSKQILAKEEPVVKNQTEETDSSGGSRKIEEYQKQETTVYAKQSGMEIPFVLQQEQPEIEGVFIVAEGGGDGQIQFQITEAVQALFGVEPHKIKIAKRKS